MYRSGSRSSVSSHRPKESGGGGPRTVRNSGSSGPVRRTSSPPPSGSASSRTPARRPRSPSGHRGRRTSPSPSRGRRGSPSPPRGRRASPSPPRGRRVSPSPPRGRRVSPSPPRGRRVSPSPPRARRGSPPPPRGRRLFPPGPAGFRGSSRGESRSDFARDGRGDHPGDSGSRRHSPGLRSDSSLEQSLRITVGNDHFCVGIPERRRRLSDRLGSPVDNLEDMDRDDLTDDCVCTRSSQCPRGLERYISREEAPLSPFLGQLDEDYRTRETFLHRSDYSPHIGCHGTEQNRDKIKGSYSIRPEERSREAKRPRYDDTEKMHSMGSDHPSFTSGSRNYRQRRRSPSPRFLDPEFRELDLARRKREEEEERSRSLSKELVGVDGGGTSCPIPGLSGVLTASESGYSLHRPKEVSAMPRKSILKKRIEVDMEPSMQLESFASSTSSSQDHPLYSGHPSVPLSGAIATFASEIENNKGTLVETTLKEPQGNLLQWGPLAGRPKDNSPLREKFGSFLCHKEKLEMKAEGHEQHTDFLLPHERASQDGSGFSRILSMLADSTSTQEKRRHSFPDIEDEEKFLYGDEEEDLKAESPPKPVGVPKSEVMRQKASSLPSSAPAVKLESMEETNPEYAKIHDLLKTIGLDIGVAEIGKLAARTQERLHGKKPSRSSADRRSSVDRHFSAERRFSADRHSSDPHKLESREAHHSNTHSPEVSRPHPVSPVDPYLFTKNTPQFLKSDHPVGHIAGTEVVGSRFQSSVAVRCFLPSASSAPVRLPQPASLSQFHVPRASQFAAAPIPPNYQLHTIPPASFDAYRHYMAYTASRWPLYLASQPSKHPLPEPQRSLPVTKQATHSSRPNLRVIPTVTPAEPKQEDSVLSSIPAAQVSIPSLIKYNPEKISDEKNRASQKQKVIEEREKLKSDQEARQKKMYYLRNELEQLHKQQGEMLRKKQREKDGHKDPLLVEVSRLQDNIMKDIAELQQEAEEAEKKQSELDKVAQILGINILDKPQKSSNDSKEPTEKSGKAEKSKSPEKVSSSSNSSSSSKESRVNNENSHTKSPKPAEIPQPATKQSDQPIAAYEYYDAGNHWCKDCNSICGTMFDFFTHMHNKKHTQTLDPYNRPWASKTQNEAKQDAIKRTDKITVPAKGSEFLIPITGYYCQLCEEFLGDPISGEQHVKGHQHNERYKKYVVENPLYEERRNLDRQAGLAVVLETERRRQSELKRQLNEKPKEEKKEKKAKIMKEVKEDDEVSEELEDQLSGSGNSPEKAENKRKDSIKLQLKEEIKKEPPTSSSFGKFSWKKPEKEEETSSVAPCIPKEETMESSKDKEDGKAEVGKAKPIKIKLSGKTVVAHTSPWMPVVTTSTQTKIRPNLPIPSTVLRKSGSATVSKPAPLNTFLSIKSSGATTKPLPVVKESSSDLLLPPDIISKAFGGQEVILKGSPEQKMVLAEKNEPSHIPEQMLPPPPPPPLPPPPPPPVTPLTAAPTPAQTNAVTAPVKSNSTLSPGFLGFNVLNPVLPVAIMASAQPTAIPSDETAPGVSESDWDQALFSVLVCPPPPLSSVFSEQAKKVEKRNSCLATANAKDLYDIFYSSGGKGAPETKLSGGPLANGENSNFSRTESLDTSSTSALNSSASQEELPLDRSLVTASLAENPKQPIEKTVVSLGKWSVVEDVDLKSGGSSYGFLQPLTRLCQSRPYETTTPKTDTLVMWTSNSFQSNTNRDISPEGKIELDLGEPGPPGVEPVPQLSDKHCNIIESQKLVETHLMESGNQDEKSQELHQSKDCRESETEIDTELKKRGAKLSERMVGKGTGSNVGPSSIEDSNLDHRNRYMWEGKAEQPKMQVTDKKAQQSKKLMTGSEVQSKVVIELSTPVLSSTKAKIDSFPSEGRSLLQNQQDAAVKISAPELLLQSPARSDVCLTDSAQKQGVSAGSEEWLENSAPESASRTSRYRSLKLKRERSKDFQGKMIYELAVWNENRKKPETWKSPEKPETEALELRDVHPESAVTIESKALEDLKVEELATLGNLGDMGVEFCNMRIDPAHRSPTTLSQKVCEENSRSPIGCNPSILTDFEPVPSFSEFPLDSPKTLVLNFGAEGEQNLSNPRNGRITPNISKTVLPTENVDLDLGSLEGTHQALDLLAGGKMSEEVEETSQLEKQDSLKLESETINPTGPGPSPCLPDLVDFVTRTSGVQKEKLCSHLSVQGDPPECSSLEMGPLQLEIVNASITEVAIPQVDEDNDNNPLNLVKSLASGSPTREQVVGGSMVPQEIPAQEAAVDAIQDHTESSVHD